MRKALPLLFCLLSSAVGAQASRDTAVGTWPFLVGNMDGQIDRLVNDTVSNGLDTLYVNVFRAAAPRTGTLWITDSAGTWNQAWGSVRPSGVGINLVNLIAKAHARELQVVGVLKCFDTSAQPTDASHRQYLLDVIDYLVNSYDTSGKPVYALEGLALDYVRYVGTNNVDPTPVTNFVQQVKARLGVLTLHAYLLAGRYTLDGPTYDSRFNSYTSVISSNSRQYGQHWEHMARHVDVMMPMAYTANGSIYGTYAAHQAYVRQASAYVRSACQRAGFPGRRVAAVIRTWTDSRETCTAQTVEASITGALQGGANGYQAFRYTTLKPHGDWWSKMRASAVAGANRPIAVLRTSPSGPGVLMDATGSHDGDEPTSGLQVRFDWDGDGRFDTPLSTNKSVLWTPPGPGMFRIGMEVRDSTGLTGYTTCLVRHTQPTVLAINRPTISAAAGGTAILILDAEPSLAGKLYVLAGTVSGTTPGTSLGPGKVLPLNVDALTLLLLQSLNTPLFSNSVGRLSPVGDALTFFVAPPGLLSGLVNRTMHFAGVVIDDSGNIALITNAVALRVTN